MIEVSVIIVDYHSARLVEKLTRSLPKKRSVEVIVVDNSAHNRGFGRACNEGAKKARGRYLLFLNPDTTVMPGAIDEMVKVLQIKKQVGIVGPQLIGSDGRAYSSSVKQPRWVDTFVVYSFLNTLFPNNKYSTEYWYKKYSLFTSRQVDSVSGAAMMIPKDVFNQVGGFDERFFMYWEDLDISEQVRQAGYQVWFEAKARVKHIKAQSTPPTTKTRWMFRRSRAAFMTKYFGLIKGTITETWLTLQEEWRLLLILLLAAWLRIDRLATLMPLISDQGRDFLAARAGLQSHRLPLLGIPSSVPRFSQGPLYIWCLMIVMALFGYDPTYLGIMAALFGLAAVAGTYLVAERYANRTVAVMAALLMATAPLAVTQSRLAFHPNLIPLASVLFLWRLLVKPRSVGDFLWLGLTFGLLFELELATIPLIVLVVIYSYVHRSTISKRLKAWGWSLIGVGGGLAPKLIYDLGHQFSQVGLFGVWMGYRVVSLFGWGGEHTMTGGRLFGYLGNIDGYLTKFFIWSWPAGRWLVYSCLILMVGWMVWHYKKLTKLEWWIGLWLGITFLGFMVHSQPSEAYFPILFVPLSLLVALAIDRLPNTLKVGGLVALGFLAGMNALFLPQHSYLMSVPGNQAIQPPGAYGAPLFKQEEIARYIAAQSHGRPIYLIGIGPGAEFASFLDNYRYLLQLDGVQVTDDQTALPVWIIQDPTKTYVIPDALMTQFDGVSVGVGG